MGRPEEADGKVPRAGAGGRSRALEDGKLRFAAEAIGQPAERQQGPELLGLELLLGPGANLQGRE